jgi:hypothetical protein
MITPRYRTVAAVALMAAGGIVAILGYLGVSRELEVAFQLPYLASAGVGAVLLLGAGVGLLLSSQLERDTARLDELEESVRSMASELGRVADDVERWAALTEASAPARRNGRSKAGAST